jgi:digeranylgeranylglycerophospholipid reductase
VQDLTEEMDLVVDATGQPSITSQLDGSTYAGQMTAMNADVTGDFADLYPRALIFFENFLGYSWAFPKTPERANVGIGWAGDSRPDDYMAAFERACRRNDWPVPDWSAVNVDTIPRGPSLDPDRAYLPEHGVVRVGDAAGIANRFTGKGISQAVESSYLLGRCLAEDDLASYPNRLYDRLRMEYLLAYVVRGALAEGRADILAETMQVVSGIDVETVDREPRHALARIARKPGLVGKIVTNREMVARLYRAYTGKWEYTREAGA